MTYLGEANQLADSARPAAGELVRGRWLLTLRESFAAGAVRRELGERALDLLPDLAKRDAEDALAALQQVHHLVARGARVHADAVAHQRDPGEVRGSVLAQERDRRADLLQRDTGVKQRLHHAQHENVAEPVQPLRP